MLLSRRYIAAITLIINALTSAFTQDDKLAYLFAGVVYDEYLRPVPYTQVVAHGTGSGDVSDSLGIFNIYIRIQT